MENNKKGATSGTFLMYGVALTLLFPTIYCISHDIPAITTIGVILVTYFLAGVDLASIKNENEAIFNKMPALLRKLYTGTNQRKVSFLSGGALVLLILSLVAGNYIHIEELGVNVSKFADFFLYFTLFVILLTYAIKQHIRDVQEETHDNDDAKISLTDSLAVLAQTEFETYLQINKAITELRKFDQIELTLGRPHDGWGMFESYFTDYEIHGGPFHDLLLNKLFWDFINELRPANSLLSTMANADHNRRIGEIKMFGIDMDVHSFGLNRGHGNIDDALAIIASAETMWDTLRNHVTKYYEKHHRA